MFYFWEGGGGKLLGVWWGGVGYGSLMVVGGGFGEWG